MFAKYFLPIIALLSLVNGDCSFYDTFNCTRNANMDLKNAFEATNDSEVRNETVCLNMQLQYSCYDQNSYSCLPTDDETKTTLLSYQEYVQPLQDGIVYRACKSGRFPPWRFMMSLTGTTNCDYVEYHTDLLPSMQNCLLEKLKTQTEKVEALEELGVKDPQKFYSEFACSAYKDIYGNCRNGIRSRCFSEAVAEATKIQENKKFFDNFVFQVRTKYPNFAFDGNCL